MGALTMTDEQKKLFDALTTLQQEICLNSLSGMNDIDSYKASSGKAKTVKAMEASVCQILGHPRVVVFMDSMKQSIVSAKIMEREEALSILSANARVKISDIADFSYSPVGVNSDGEEILESIWRMKDSSEIDPEVMACIKSVTMTKQGPKIELHDQQAAIKQLSAMQGWDSATKINLSSPDGTMSPTGKSLDDFYKETDVPA